VPQFYLRRFSISEKVELIQREDTNRRFETSVGNALVERHFYTIPGVDEAPDTAFEKMLADQIEGPGADGIRRIVDERRAATFPKPRSSVARLVAFQYLRGPSSRFATVEQYKGLVKKTAKLSTPEMFKRYLGEMMAEDVSDEEAQELYEFAQDDEQYEIGVSSESLLHAQLAVMTVPTIVRRLLARTWEVVEFKAPLLVTGDEPVALMDEDAVDPGEALGISLASTIVFPTDPWHAILMHRGGHRQINERRIGDAALAHRINRHVAFACHRFIVQRPGGDSVADLALPGKAGPVETIGPYVLHRRNLSERGAKLMRDMMLRRVQSAK
jgi:hypothetical protein